MDESQQDALRVFTAALTLSDTEEREQYLDEACRGKPELRRRVEASLSSTS